jgi:acyl-CoA dehydrogenase
MKTTATRKGDKWVINGSKCFITNGEYANYYTVYAKTDKEAGHRGISCFIVPRDAGVVVDKHEDKMGQRASNTATITFPEVEIPLDHLVGEENKGFKIAMMTLDRTRPGVAAMGVGVARAAMEFAIDYSKERVQFGVPIAMHQGIQFIIADMATKVHLARLAGATRSSPRTPSALPPTPRWRSRPTPFRSMAATASSRSTRWRS